VYLGHKVIYSIFKDMLSTLFYYLHIAIYLTNLSALLKKIALFS